MQLKPCVPHQRHRTIWQASHTHTQDREKLDNATGPTAHMFTHKSCKSRKLKGVSILLDQINSSFLMSDSVVHSQMKMRIKAFGTESRWAICCTRCWQYPTTHYMFHVLKTTCLLAPQAFDTSLKQGSRFKLLSLTWYFSDVCFGALHFNSCSRRSYKKLRGVTHLSWRILIQCD